MVEGLPRLRRRLTQTIPDNVRKRGREVLAQNADELVAEMKRLVPVGKYVGGGELRDSIAWKWGDAPKGYFALASIPSGDPELRITIYAGGPNAFYGFFQEFGTQNMAAQPFFFPSYRKLRSRMKGRMTRELKKAIRAAR